MFIYFTVVRGQCVYYHILLLDAESVIKQAKHKYNSS